MNSFQDESRETKRELFVIVRKASYCVCSAICARLGLRERFFGRIETMAEQRARWVRDVSLIATGRAVMA